MKDQGQSVAHSWYETWCNIAIGWSLNYILNLTILPFWGIYIDPIDNIAIGSVYTVISIIRGFYIRRFWNWIHIRQTQKISSGSLNPSSG